MRQLYAQVRELVDVKDDLLKVCKEWGTYFARLNEESEPGDPLIEARRVYHGTRIGRTLAAIARAEGETK